MIAPTYIQHKLCVNIYMIQSGQSNVRENRNNMFRWNFKTSLFNYIVVLCHKIIGYNSQCRVFFFLRLLKKQHLEATNREAMLATRLCTVMVKIECYKFNLMAWEIEITWKMNFLENSFSDILILNQDTFIL